jgi:hypothetical protein
MSTQQISFGDSPSLFQEPLTVSAQNPVAAVSDDLSSMLKRYKRAAKVSSAPEQGEKDREYFAPLQQKKFQAFLEAERKRLLEEGYGTASKKDYFKHAPTSVESPKDA